MDKQIKRFHNILKAVYSNYYSDLGETEIIDDNTIENIKIKVIPNEGIHAGIEYKITIKFRIYILHL